jgi:hypothetical protein
MREAKQSELTGKAGEHAVATQLLLRGVITLWPSVDRGSDLYTENGCRIQVRCAHLYHHKKYQPRYFFPLPKTRRIPNSDKTTILVVRKPFVEVCDFVIFWGIEQNRFWVVPAALVDESTGIELGTEIGSRFVGSIKDMREMISLGYTRGKVAKHYGIHRTSLQLFLDSGKDSVDETVVSKIRACEGRWELITEFVRPAVAVNAMARVEEA